MVKQDFQKNDRLLPETKLLAAFIVPFLIVAWGILFLFTSRTESLFAWTIRAPMTAMMLASAYAGGAYFFARTVTAKSWHHVGIGFLPVASFASCLCVATVIHSDIFSRNIPFYVWTALYFTTPALVFIAWLRNRAVDNGELDNVDLRFSKPVQFFLGAVGLFYVFLAVFLLVWPEPMIDVWAWQLTPLTARVVGAMLMLFGVFNLMVALDGRWSSARVALQALVFTMLFSGIAVIRAWDSLFMDRALTWIFIGTIAFVLTATPIFYATLESRLKAKHVA